MFKITLSVFCFFCCLTGFAQVTTGTIDYVQTTEFEFTDELKSDMADNKAIKDAFASMRAGGAFDKNFRATFTAKGFTCVEQVKEVTTKTIEMAGGGIMQVETGGGEPTHYYTNVKTGEVENTTFIADRKFLVNGAPEKLDWVLTDETVPPSEATIGLELKVAKAVNAAGDTVTAGYAPALPVQVGPMNYYGLPGAIITLRIPKGENSVSVFRPTAMQVLPKAPKLEKPTEGKKISLERFYKEKAKRRKGPMIIERRN